MRLPTQDSATGRGLKTAVQSMIGYVVGLAFVVWAVPGVPQAVTSYANTHWLEMLAMIGVPSGLTAFITNFLRTDVTNY